MVKDLEKIIVLVENEAEHLRQNAGWSGDPSDLGASAILTQVRFYREGMEGKLPLEWLKYQKALDFGMGGGLLQKLDRDTQKMAYKCSSAVVDGEQRNVFKDPVTDAGKRSKKGELELIKNVEIANQPSFSTVSRYSIGKMPLQPHEGLAFQTVYENGPRFLGERMAVIRNRAQGRV